MQTSTATDSSGKKEKLLEKIQRWGSQIMSCWARCSKSDCCEKKKEKIKEPSAPEVYPVRNPPSREPSGPTGLEPREEDPQATPTPLPRSAPIRDTPYEAKLQGYSVYTLKNFPFNSFQSANYESVFRECEKWVAPLQYNYALQEKFLNLLDLKNSDENLRGFTSMLLEMSALLKEGRPLPPSTVTEFVPVLEKLTQEADIKMDEIKSMILVAEAFLKYTTRVSKKVKNELPPDKRQKLISFLMAVPYGGGFTFTQKDDFELLRDPDLLYIISRSEFKHNTELKNGTYDPPVNDAAGPIGAAFFLLLGTMMNE